MVGTDGGESISGAEFTQTNIDKVIKTLSHAFPESPAHPAWSTVSCEVESGFS